MHLVSTVVFPTTHVLHTVGNRPLGLWFCFSHHHHCNNLRCGFPFYLHQFHFSDRDSSGSEYSFPSRGVWHAIQMGSKANPQHWLSHNAKLVSSTIFFNLRFPFGVLLYLNIQVSTSTLRSIRILPLLNTSQFLFVSKLHFVTFIVFFNLNFFSIISSKMRLHLMLLTNFGEAWKELQLLYNIP